MNPRTLYIKESEDSIQVCPWGYFICSREGKQKCLLEGKLNGTEDVQDWKKQATNAQQCKHRNEPLTQAQWMHKRRGVWL